MRNFLVWLVRLGWFLLLVWVLVLGSQQGTFRSIILPLFVIGVVYGLQEYASKHLPGFSEKWRFSLLVLTALFTARTAVWPWVVQHFPATWAAAHQELKTRDILTAQKLDSCSAAAVLDALNEYRGGLDEAEGRNIKNELRILITRKKVGPFTEGDQKQLDAVFARVKKFAEQRDELRHLMHEVCPDEEKVGSVQTSTPADRLTPASNSRPNGAASVNPVSVSIERPGAPGQNRLRDGQRSAGSAPLTFNPFNPDPSVVAGKINTALVIDAPIGPDGFEPSNALYGLLSTSAINVVLNLFDEQRFKSSGAFAGLYGGDTQFLHQTGALAKVDYLVLAKVLYSFSGFTEIDQDLRSCRLTFSYKTFDRGANVIKADSLTAVGAGLSEVAALKTALERLAQGHATAILTGR